MKIVLKDASGAYISSADVADVKVLNAMNEQECQKGDGCFWTFAKPVARVVVGEHSVRMLERLLEGELNDDDDITEVSVVEREFDTPEEVEAYKWGVLDTADEHFVLTDHDSELLTAAVNKAEGRAG